MPIVNPRTGRTLEDIVDGIGSCKVSCGLCNSNAPCPQCAILTKLANWHTPAEDRKLQRQLARLRVEANQQGVNQ